ncbi:ABC transporter permease [Bacteroidota bacterium]
MWLNYIKIAIRILIRNYRLSLISLISFTVGLTGFIVIFSWVRTELSVDRFFKNKDQIVQLTIRHPSGILDPNTPYALAPLLAEKYPEIASYSTCMRLETLTNSSFLFRNDTSVKTLFYEPKVVRVDTSFFSIFDFPMVRGSRKAIFSGPGDVVISQRISEKYFPDIDPVGRTVVMNNSQVLTITGVVNIPENTFFEFDVFLPVFRDLSTDWNWRDPSFLLLSEGTDKVQFGNKIAKIMNDVYPHRLPGEMKVELLPLTRAHMELNGRGKIYLFSVVAMLLLLVAALNYMNLITANYTIRIKETGIRKVLGALNKQVTIHIFVETIVISLAALIVALFLSELIIPRMSNLFGRSIRIGYLEHPVILLIILAIVITIAGLASIYPAVLFSRASSARVLHGSPGGQLRRTSALIVSSIVQFTLAIALMISMVIVLRQVRYLTGKSIGISVENVISIPMNNGIGRNFQQFLDRLESHPDIEMVSAGQAFPFHEDYKTNIDWQGRSENNPGNTRYSICLENYPELFRMEAVKGRIFSSEMETDIDKYVINEQAASMLNFENPVGEYLNMWGRTGEIIGVVKDFNHVSLHREILPHVFNVHPSNYRAFKYIFVKTRSGIDPGMISFLQETCEELAPDFPFSYSWLEEDLDSLYDTEKNLGKILGLFTLLSLLISSLGIYGLAYYTVEKNAGSLAIRKVFGAKLQHILLFFIKGMTMRIGISILLSIFLAFMVTTKWLDNFAYRINGTVLVYLWPALFATIIALAAVLLAIWRTANKNPAEILKQE